jgi:hypothetical protein
MPILAGLRPIFFISKFPFFARSPKTIKKAAEEISPGTPQNTLKTL